MLFTNFRARILSRGGGCRPLTIRKKLFDLWDLAVRCEIGWIRRCKTGAIFLAGFLAILSVFGNGGSFNASAVYRAGNLVPMEKRLISLETESLNIRIERDEAMVEVTYGLVNHGPGDSVTFGFPVDLAKPETLNTPNGYDYVLGTSLRDFVVVDGTEKVNVEKVIDKPLGLRERRGQASARASLFNPKTPTLPR